MFGELIPLGGGDNIPLLDSKIVIGRRASCDIVLGFPNVSSQHCEMELISGYWQIRDLGSRNGVKVNGERYDKKWLHPGDQVSIATNHFEIAYEAVGEPPREDDNPFEMSLLEKAGLESNTEQRRSLPRAASSRPVKKKSFGADEDAAMDWLMGED